MKIVNVKIINPTETINNADVIIENGKIKSIIIKEGSGTSILIPGFVDTHTHGYYGNDAMDGKDANIAIAKAMAKNGVTAYLATAMTQSEDNMINALKSIAIATSDARNIVGIHMEGPFISSDKKGAHDGSFLMKPSIDFLNKLQNAANGMIMKMTFAPEIANDEFIKEMVSLNIVPTIGHTNASAEESAHAVSLGATAATHLWNAMSGVSNRNPGVVEDILMQDKVYAELIVDLVHVDESTIKLSIKSKGVDKIVAITDSIRPAGLPDGDSISGGLDIIKKGNLITIKGTDIIAGSGATMHENFKNLIDMGYKENDVVKMTSTNAAKNIKIDAGEIRENSDADIIIMDNEYNIKEVYLKGELCK